jgi:hypothetical protein
MQDSGWKIGQEDSTQKRGVHGMIPTHKERGFEDMIWTELAHNRI